MPERAVVEIRSALVEGRRQVPRVGAVRAGPSGAIPFVVVDESDRPIEAFSVFLRDLMLTDMSLLTCRSYGNDLLRWWRLLRVLGIGWDRASRAEVEVLVSHMRSADNPQRRRSSSSGSSSVSSTTPGSVNLRTGKPALRQGYAPATINHALSVVSSFYAFHAQFGIGPVVNPVPVSSTRRGRLAHRSPLEPGREFRRAALRQKSVELTPRAIPDALADELAAMMRSSRDRALLAMFLSSGARASELLAVTGERVDWTRQQVWVVSKGTRALQPVPASPDALRLLAVYYDEHGSPAPGEAIWRTLRGTPRPLSYFAARRVLQRANSVLGTDWTLHDLRHTTIQRMTSDPQLSLTDVMAVSRHQHVASLDPYLRPSLEQIFDRLQRHYAEPRPTRTLTPGYDAEDFRTVFGG
ncbi:MAG: tyrosine-type recombinase/integrase [Actinobacteria bacterium]|nr:tyrosine-type recombinase/integrase [Actinomycetota bacterium]